MFEYEVGRIRELLINVLGEPKNEPYSSGWQSFNCPYCAESENVSCDGKYNLETNIEHGCIFHCWKCETKGKISKILRDYGSGYDISEYREIINTIKNSSMYSMDDSSVHNEIIDLETCLALPKEYKKIDESDKNAKKALDYLNKRGIGKDIIEKYSIGYTPYYCENFMHKCRIIIPSYDSIGDLNYWVGRDYSGLNKVKYCNPKIQKTSIVFNESMINWYENITLVEGPFDHIVVPNSIPLLGKSISKNNVVYNTLLEKSNAEINIFLDDDALQNAYKMYLFLNNNGFKNRVRIIKCPDGYDASLIYEKFGKDGIINLLKTAEKIDEYTLCRFFK